ncbi:MAG: TadE/TadG family type IV pilus assembly protein [Rhizobacter sp.]
MTRIPGRCLSSRRERGVIAVEFAIVATLLTTIVFGATELGRAMVQYDALVKSARSAARYLAQFNSGDATAQTQARCLAVYGTTTCGNTPLVAGLTTSLVSIKDAASDPSTHAMQRTLPAPNGSLVNLVTVTIAGFQFQSLASAVVPSFTMDTISATMPQVN